MRQASHLSGEPHSDDDGSPRFVPPKPASDHDVPQQDHDVPADSLREIDLPTSLALVSGDNPRVGYVRQRIVEACAELEAAEALWLPSVRVGANYNKHEGSLQDVGGRAIDVSRGSMFTGFGARAVGASSPAVPGLSASFHLADAIFQPLIAQRTLAARKYAADSTTNDLLYQAAVAHLDLVQAVQHKRIALETLDQLHKLAELTASFAATEQGTQADADRARTERDLQRNVVTRAEEGIRVAAARLAEVLNLDDGMQLRPSISTIVKVNLVPEDSDIEALVSEAFENRPEMSQNTMEVSAATQRYRRERYLPLIPHLGAGMSYGGFGGGTGGTIAHYRDRFDLDAWAYWEVRNLGVGEQTARDAARARIVQTRFRGNELANRIRREVVTANARVHSARHQVDQAHSVVNSAADSYRRNLERIRNTLGLPLEVLQSIQALNASKRELLDATASYNRSQFELHRARGWPLAE